jgi:hypothetical protein
LLFSLPSLAAAGFLAFGFPGQAVAGTRFDEFTAKFAKPANPVRVLHAGLLGGAGTEWLVGGGFQADGTIVLGGVSLGPALELGVAPTVLGKDAPIAAPQQTAKRDKKGNPEMDKEGRPQFEPFAWHHEQATAFVVRLAPDLQQIKSVTRFAWKCAGLTGMAVDPAGNIYLTGQGSEALAELPGDVKELPPPATPPKNGRCSLTYVAKLAPDASRVAWVRTIRGASAAPAVSLDSRQRLLFRGPDLRVLDAEGRQISAIALPGDGGFTAVSPVDGSIAHGGEHHWPTGREPWRCPTLNLHKSDGALLYQLYDWGGPLVGLDSLRLVSDTAIRGVAFDSAGGLLLHAWSDGGNSVALREPMDIRAEAKMGGLGFSAWGAGVLSLAYIIRIDPQSCRVTSGTPWMAYQKSVNKPNSARINALAAAVDGSVCFAGSSTHGLIQTADAIGGGEPGGEFVTVLDPDFAGIRFCSAMPGCGQAIVDDNSADRGRWGIVSGKSQGRSVVMFLGGAAERNSSYDQQPPPAVGARQKTFGGGHLDGYVLLLDLGK